MIAVTYSSPEPAKGDDHEIDEQPNRNPARIGAGSDEKRQGQEDSTTMTQPVPEPVESSIGQSGIS